MTTATKSPQRNGRVARPTLSEQIDRFDRMLDGLGDALQEVIADAVRTAVAEAVLTVLADPNVLRAALARHEPPRLPVWRRVLGWASTTAGSLLQRARSAVCVTARTLTSVVRRTASAVCERTTRLVRRVTKTLHLLTWVWHFRRLAGLALTVGFATGVLAFVAGPLIASLISAVGGTATTILALLASLIGRMLVLDELRHRA